MNILITSASAGLAGSTYSVFYLAQGLIKKGYKVFLACPEKSLLADLVKNLSLTFVPVEFHGKVDLPSIKKIAQVVKENSIDIIDSQASRDRYATIFAKRMYSLNTILVLTRRQLAKSAGILERTPYYERRTDKIVAVSQGVKDSLTKIGIRKNHIQVIFNGTPAEKYQQIDLEHIAALRKQYGIQEGNIVIGSIARLKEQQQILKALKLVDTKVKVLFVGINEQPDFLPLIQEFKVPHEIHYVGEVSNVEALHFHALMTMHVLASTIEGLSQSLLESMALGVPVVATRIGGNPELIKEGENGLLFNNNDIVTLAHQINRLIHEPDFRIKLVHNGRKTAMEDFSIDKMIDRYDSFFHDLKDDKERRAVIGKKCFERKCARKSRQADSY